MKNKLVAGLIALSMWWSMAGGFAAQTNDVKVDLKALVAKIQAKLDAHKRTEADLADEFKQFDTILAQHKDEKSDELANVLFMKAMLYLEVLDDTSKGAEIVKQIKRDFPNSGPGKNADDILENIKKQDEAKQVRNSLALGAQFPDFDEKDLDGKPLSVAGHKGKVVLIDFWATWCGPCVHELPNVIKTYEKYHGKGFDVIGISLDKQAQEKSLRSFLKEKNMTWPQFFDGKYWENKLAGKYGVQSIPTTFLLDRDGKIIGKNLRGGELEPAVAKALANNLTGSPAP